MFSLGISLKRICLLPLTSAEKNTVQFGMVFNCFSNNYSETADLSKKLKLSGFALSLSLKNYYLFIYLFITI